MKPQHHPSSYSEIDWPYLHEQARSKKAWQSKDKSDWDKKAPSFSKKTKDSSYAKHVLEHIPVSSSTSILDIGAGSGALAVPLAHKAQQVTAIDYSQGMINELQAEAKQQGLANITCHTCAWEDDWVARGISPHDICIASRSIGVQNLSAALKKINNFAQQQVFISDRVNPTPFDKDAFKAIKRPFQAGPDYIFSLNMLYSFGIHPEMHIIEFDKETQFKDLNAAVDSFEWMFHGMTNLERERLHDYLRERVITQTTDQVTIGQGSPHRWALISWKKEKHIE